MATPHNVPSPLTICIRNLSHRNVGRLDLEKSAPNWVLRYHLRPMTQFPTRTPSMEPISTLFRRLWKVNVQFLLECLPFPFCSSGPPVGLLAPDSQDTFGHPGLACSGLAFPSPNHLPGPPMNHRHGPRLVQWV